MKKTILFTLLTVICMMARSQNLILPRINANEANVISLAGEWEFSFDPDNVGVTEEWFKHHTFDDAIMLPSTTDEQKKGKEEHRQEGRFTRIHAYRGAAWYRTEVDIPKEMKGKRLVFSMERTKITRVWFNGQLVGNDDSLITTQYFVLTENAKPGKHTITVRVNNGQDENPPIGGNHQVSDGTQTNWNGILGKIQIKASDQAWIEKLNAYPNIDEKKVKIQVTFGRNTNKALMGKLTVNTQSWNTNNPNNLNTLVISVDKLNEDNSFEFNLPIGDTMQLWSEFEPVIYRLSVDFEGKTGKEKATDSKEIDFGMRKFHTIGTSFAINGKKTFLRGKHDGAVFPHTGYPPMDVEEWVRILNIIKSYGINHIRCHTWCPPAAAFEACDQLGMYMLPELPHWGGVGNKPKIVEGDVEQKLDVFDNTTEYLIKESYRLFDEFGNYPSFVMFEIGNELSGEREAIDHIITDLRVYDPRHLFAGGSNNFLWTPRQSPADDFWATTMTGGTYGTGVYYDTKGLEVRSSYPNHKEGHVNNLLAGTDYDYSTGIKHVTVPVISHENGQYQVYPNYKEIETFTGVTRAYNFEAYRERLRKAGMLDLADDFFRASGALAVICYREDLESAIRTPGFGGFQVLDLQDFPGQGTALVGILDAQLESKGLITPKK